MTYELSPFPMSLFDAQNVIRKADKPKLAHAIMGYSTNVSSNAILENTKPKTEHYVLDGGSLLHRLPWKTGDSYGDIAKKYGEFTIRHYGLATVVFDSYAEGPSIKDNTHQRRWGNVHPVVSFTPETKFQGKREEFLSRNANKQSPIHLISEELRKIGCMVINAAGDADVDIAKAAIDASHRQTTTLIGEDTDLLVLLLHYSRTGEKALYF